jgi:hypothetical protein
LLPTAPASRSTSTRAPATRRAARATATELVTLDFAGRSAFYNPRLLWAGDASSADTALYKPRSTIRGCYGRRRLERRHRAARHPGWPWFLPDVRALMFNRSWGVTSI